MSNIQFYARGASVNNDGTPKDAQDGAELRDVFAVHAPPSPDWFVPHLYPRPATQTSPAARFGLVTSEYYTTYWGLYNEVTKVWNDEEAELEGVAPIPEEVKNEVAEYVTNYEDYLHDDYLWQRHYEQEKMYQWPYRWADNQLLQRDAHFTS